MAQPLFNEHPLQDYLRQSGDIFEPIPGAMSDLPDPFSEECADTDTDADLRLWSWLRTPVLHLVQIGLLPTNLHSHKTPATFLPRTLFYIYDYPNMILNVLIFQSLNVIVTSAQNHHSTLQKFSEKFQYDVISSSLLSSSITAPSSTRRRSSSSTDDAPDDPDLKSRTQPSPPIPSHPVEHRSSARSLTLLCLCCISLFFDSFILCVLMGTALYYLESYTVQPGNLPDFIAPTLGSLNDLIAAANLWDSAVHEAINLLELEESMSSSLSPSSPLRVALHSSLQSTQVQSDNVRHVLVGLTSPSALAQLSEMYAPPSPLKPLATLHSRSGSATAGSLTRTASSDKRATWSGTMSYSYSALANAGSPSRRSLVRWEKRRSDLSALLLRPSGAAMSAPTTPEPGKSLDGVEEERGNNPAAASLSDQEGDTDAVVPLSERGQFASAALEFQRQKRSRGVETLFPSTRSPPPKYTAISPQPPTSTHITRLGNRSPPIQSPPPSSYSASRFTAMQMPRHPLSLYTLTSTLNGALAARRYAASHLLALRFGAGDGLEDNHRGGDSYWEDVRAVMALLTSALANATAPLVEALEAAEHERLLTENPTPTTAHSRTSSESHTRPSSFHQHQYQQRQARRASSHVTSFAPLPSHLSRFAAHVDALTNALHDAREHLESCVASLRDGTSTTSGSPQDAPALRAYERLRRELGLALRECERGREPLLELLLPPRALSPDEDEDEEVPALGPDAESSDSDKDASSRAALSLPSSPTHAVLVEARPPGNEEEDEEEDGAAHDRKGGVLVVGLERLPAPGIEQVFEADAGADVDTGPDADADMDADGPRPLARPRSKLSRAERIAAAKARRATGGLGLSVGDQGDRDGTGVQWAPVGDVVQELKDVIWKVGEQRRMREQRQREGEELDRAPIAEDVFTCPTS
ncbi:hypothetical protein BJY52DRAFT_1189618 [Lactarius psammicola]|nr:hypothetical protein BJY52DRAFT_1189618 [Lactarius psammicola]